ncbi:MAG: tandem-95 repeat protein [Nanoarchaeota archaeon]
MRVRALFLLIGSLFLLFAGLVFSAHLASAQAVINEVLYAAPAPQKENELIELFLFDPNLNISNYTLKIGNTLETLTPDVLVSSPFVLIIADTSNITAANASIYRVKGALGNTGMSSTTVIQLISDTGIPIDLLDLSFFAPTKTNYSLERFNPNNSAFAESLIQGGTPGYQNSVAGNIPPILNPIGDRTLLETQFLTIQLNASDPDNDPLLFDTNAAGVLPSPFAFDINTGLFSWTPTITDAGNYSITFNVTDGIDWDSETITITVLNLNRAPSFSPLGKQSILEDTNLTINLSQYATDPDGEALAFYALSIDNITLAINQTTSIATLIPDSNFFGSRSVIFIAQDPFFATASSVLFLSVTSVNDIPEIRSTPNLTVQQDSLYAYNMILFDGDNDPLITSLAVAPAGMVLSNAGNITWTPNSSQVAPTPVSIVVVDTANASVMQNFTITVLNKNDAPKINSTPVTTATQDTPYVYQVTAHDPDLSFGDTLIFILKQAPQFMAIAPTTGIIAWVPQFNQVGQHPIIVEVRDAAGLTDLQSFTIQVANVNDPPTQPTLISPFNGALLRDPTVLLQWNPSTDPDNDSVSYYVVTGELINQGLNATNVTVIQTTNLQHTITLEDNKTYGWGIIATDGVLNASSNLSVFFTSFFNPPTIQVLAPNTLTPSVQENATLLFAVNVTDPDGDPVVSIAWYLDTQLQTTSSSFTYAPTFGDSGIHNVTVVATDNTSRSSFVFFAVTVLDTNRAPDLDPISNQSTTQGIPLKTSITASDLDLPFGDQLTYTTNNPRFTVTKNSATQADFSFTPTNNEVGTQQVIVTVTDTAGATDTESFWLTVANINDPPTITSSPLTSAVINIPYMYDLKATDPDLQFGDALTFTFVTAPPTMVLTKIDTVTGRIMWTPNASEFGQHQVLVKVSDNANATVTQQYQIQVAQVGNGTLVILDQFSATKPTFGDDNQQASNPRSDESSEFDIFDATTIRIQNAGSSTLSNFTLSVAPLSGFSLSDLNISLQSTPTVLAKGASATISLKARIPETLDAVDQNDDAVALPVADITVEAQDTIGAPIRTTFRAFMQRENQLDLTDTTLFVNDKSSKNVDDKDDIKDIKPKDRFELEITAENTYDQSTNLDMKDVGVRIDCDDQNDFDFDDKTEDIGDIGTEDEETTTFTFAVEDDAADSDTKCTLVIEGDDENRARHAESLEFTLSVQRESHDLQIEGLDATPSSILCETQNINIRADIRNLGKTDESDAVVEIISKDLSYQLRTNSFELDEDNVQDVNFLIPVPPSLTTGEKAIQIKTFYDNTKESNSETISVDNQCGARATIPTRQQRGAADEDVVITLGQSSLDAAQGSTVSIPVKVANTGSATKEFIIAFTNIEEFAEPSPTKKILLKPGQTSTLYMNLKIKPTAPVKKQSATITVAADGKSLAADTIALEVTGKNQGDGAVRTTLFWIIINLLLVIIVLFLIDKFFIRKY